MVKKGNLKRLLRRTSQVVVALLVVSTFVLFPPIPQAAMAVQADGSDSEIDYALLSPGSGISGFRALNHQVLPAASDFSVEVWVRPTSLPYQWNSILHNRHGTNYSRFDINIGGGTAGSDQIQIVYNPENANSTDDIVNLQPAGFRAPAGQWTHIAITVDITSDYLTLSYYLNGQLHGTHTQTTVTFGSLDSNFFVGYFDYNSSMRTFNGLIDQIKVWNTPLTQTQVAESMHSLGAGGVSGAPSLRHHYDFNEGAGSVVYDRVGTKNLEQVGSISRRDVKQMSSVAGGDTVITFPRTYLPGVGGWRAPSSSSQSGLRVLAVAGGGAGGSRHGGGGGAGALAIGSGIQLNGVVPVKIGQGGIAANANDNGAVGTSGQSTVLGDLVLAGGGRGNGGGNFGGSAESGGSGPGVASGVGYQAPPAVAASTLSYGLTAQGNMGAYGYSGQGNDWAGGGGGGAGSVGGASSANSNGGGAGGTGVSSDITGTAVCYAAGGGGGVGAGSAAAAGAAGSCASGGTSGGAGSKGNIAASSGVTGTGSGGGGAGYSTNTAQASGAGGSGLVVIRYTPSTDKALVVGATQLATGTTIIPTANNVAFSIETWVYQTDSTGWQGIVNQSSAIGGDSQRTFLGLQDGLIWFWANAGVAIDSGYRIAANQWNHIGVTVSGSGASGLVKIYVNGQLVKTVSSYNRVNTTGSVFHLGGTHVSSEYWRGQIDQLKVWQGELSAADLALSMHTYSSSGIASAALQSLYDFNEYLDGIELNRVTNQLALSLSSVVTAANYTASGIIETGNASATDSYVKFNRSYLTALGGWTPVSGISRYQALVVAGGGGGGAWVGAGGGAGGLTISNTANLSSVTKITVGQGGLGALFEPSTFATNGLEQKPSNGQTSSLGVSLQVLGGGYGGSHTGGSIGAGAIPATGGSGGGGTGRSNSSVYNLAYLGASGISGSGFAGGNGSATAWVAGGGGGAGAPGAAATSTQGGNGGAGYTSAITGVDVTYAGGGGGSLWGSAPGQGLGGSGGGGNAGFDTTPGGSGLAATGGGGGGGAASSATTRSQGGNGGSGVVILAYSLAPDAPSSLTATRTSTHATVNLSWTAPTYTGGSSITDYQIEYKPAGGSWTSYSDAVSSSTTATLTLPQQCVAHEFRVLASNGSFLSAASTTASATPVWGTFGSLSGVQIASTNSECVVQFTSVGSNSWTPPAGTNRVGALVIGGGGGGGYAADSAGWRAGGGGAGGVASSSAQVVGSSALTVEVGAGGAGGIGGSQGGKVAPIGGGLSRFGFLIASGGGRGGSAEPSGITPAWPGSGGSGGGGGMDGMAGGDAGIGGNAGGSGVARGSNAAYAAGGGGGAGAAGGNATGTTGADARGGNGGAGIESTITGQTVKYAWGGAGAGIFEDGVDWFTGTRVSGRDGDPNTGSGGGGGEHQIGTTGGYTAPADTTGGDGGSGVVIIRQLTVATPTITSQPNSAAVQPGATQTLNVSATGNGVLSYQWQSSTNGTAWSNVGTNSSTFTTPTLSLADNGVQYRVVVTNTLNGQTSQVTSNVATISVTGVTITAGQCSAMVGNDAGVTISETLNGGCLVEYKTPGNNSFYVPSLVSSIQAYIVGGGGGGGGANRSQGGGGGGSGAASWLVTLRVTSDQLIPISVGAGGAGGAAMSNGLDGGATAISTSYSVPGGRGGKSPTNWPGGAGQGGSGPSGDVYATSGASGGAGVRDPGDRSSYQPKYGNRGSSRTFAGKFWCVGGGGGGGNREVANDPYFHWEPISQLCTDGVTKSGGSGGWHNGTTNVLPSAGLVNSGGGGGGGSYNSTTNRAGGNGADGIVAIYFVPGAGNISLSSVAAVSYSGTTHTVTLTKDNPSTTVTWTTSNAAVCTVTGTHTSATVTEVAAGLCEVSVLVAASSPYARGTSATSFRIDKITRTAPTWTNNSASVPFGGTIDLRLKLTNPGSNAFTFTTSGTAGSCSVTGYTLNVGSVGDTCNVTPTLLGDSIYADVQGSQALSVTVTKISQSALVITSGSSTNVNQALNVSAAGGSGTGALSYHVANQGTTGCTINSSTGELTAATAGSCEVYAQRAQSTNYDAVTSSHVVVAVSKISQNLTWVSQPQARYLPGNTYALEATASSQLAVAYSISAGLCTLTGSTVTFTGSGDCVIHAGQPGDGSYFAAVTISQTVSVGKINQTMTFSALANKSWGSLAFSLSATASSGLAIVYSENNQTTNDACDVSSNGIVTIKNVGTCAVTAAQAGDASYTSVTTTRIFEVTANQAGAPFIGSISFGDRQLNASFFTPSYLGGGTVSAYELRAYDLDGTLVSTNTGCIANQGATQSCSVIGLSNGTKYVLRVAAITQAGLGQFSVSSSEIIPASNPEAVGNLIAIEGNGTLSLQWTQPTSFGGGNFFQYRIYWRAPGQQYQPDGSPGATVGNQASLSYVISGLTNGVSYGVKIVTATSNNNVELESNTAEVRQTPYTVPDAPAAVVALDNSTSFTVAWQPPTFDGGNPIDQYIVQKDGATVCTINTATSTSCEVPKPAPGTTAVIGVRAGNDAGLSAATSTSITVQALPSSTPSSGGSANGGSGGSSQVSTPTVTNVSGSSKVQPGELVRLVGTGLSKVQRVTIGGIETGFILNTAGVLQIRIPEGLVLGRVAVTLYGDFGVAIFSDLLEIVKTEVAVEPSSKVSVGSYLGKVAIYTLNHKGKRLSIRIGNKWQVIDPLQSTYTEILSKATRGKTVLVRVYLDRKLVMTKQQKVR